MYKSVIEDIKTYIRHNKHIEVSDEEILNLSKKEQLCYYLKWNGIYGYTNDILSIFDNVDKEVNEND